MMNRTVLLITLVAVGVTLYASGVESAVVTLNKDNFDTIVNDPSKHVFVKFFAPWCGHCKNMAAAWVELSNAMEGTDIVIAELDATQDREVAQKFGVRGFPTLKLFTKSDKTGKDYSGARDVASFKTFLNNNAPNTA